MAELKNGGHYNDDEGWNYHILMKNMLREMIANDPEHYGRTLSVLDELPFDERLGTHEPGDKWRINEEFLFVMVNDYLKSYKKYEPQAKERNRVEKACKLIYSLFKLDTAYNTRIGGCISYIVHNKHLFTDINADYSKEIRSIYTWWKKNEYRERGRYEINWIFTYIILKYKYVKFYKKSVNHMLCFIARNAENWVDAPEYNPDNWFGKIKGRVLIDLHGGWY